METKYIVNNVTGQTINGSLTINGDVTITGTTNVIPYKSYICKMTQTNENAPVVTELYNDTGLSLTWTRNGVGIYQTNTIQGDTDKIVCFISNGGSSNSASTVGSSIYFFTYNTFSNNFFFIIRSFATTTNGTNVPTVGLSDNLLYSASIEIRVYN